MVGFGVGLDGMVPEKRGGDRRGWGWGEFDRSCVGRQRGGGWWLVVMEWGFKARPLVRRVNSQTDAYGHTTGNTPEPVRFQKLSLVRPS